MQSMVETPYIPIGNIVCHVHVNKILLVVMAGEHRTQIRDDPDTRALLSGDVRNQQHQSIVLYEDTVYQLRIQLDCTRQRNSDLVDHNCNLAYDVNAWIDLNDDRTYDASENAAPYRWPLHSYIPQGIYDLQIDIPSIDATRIKRGPHHMQVVVSMNATVSQTMW